MITRFIGLFAFIALCSSQKTKVDVYYESLCPDSQAFITQQIYPEMKTPLAERIAINWIPFGKSTYTTQGSDVIFTCHHGANECYGNKVHACAIRHIEVDSFQHHHTKESLTLEFINCVMSAGKNFADNVYPGEKCAMQINVKNWDRIAECANTTDGDNLLRNFGIKTMELKPKLTSVPTITINDQFDDEVQASALKDFRMTLCKFISSPQPQVCTAGSGAESILIMLPLLAVAAYFTRLF